MTIDRHIQERVLAALECDRGVRAEQIGVTVVDGVVTLRGGVTTLREKFLAERIARRLSLVRAVANDLEVAPGPAGSRDDSAIAAAAANALEWDSALPNGSIKATVRNGWVTLTGTAAWAYQRSAAERVIRNLSGVKGIANYVVIEPEPSAGDVEACTERPFDRAVKIEP
jgi:osmotically-inducible protein OsmY